MDLTASHVLSTWSAGLAVAAAVVVWWRVVGRGYLWLAAGTTVLFGVPAAWSGGGAWAWAGCGLATVAILLAGRPGLAALALGAGGAAFGVAAMLDGPVLLTISGALLLGGITAEMMLGHWFLVDPTLPRWALRRLDVAGGAGVVVDAIVLAALGVFPWASVDLVLGIGFLALSVMTVILMVAVWYSLAEEGYSGVMAATGLSYLAVLTAIGAAVVGRLLVDGPVLGS
ncbi:hypothetical protein HQ535_08165 [bacterium]|nr:hypothetical protein [bacterium]